MPKFKYSYIVNPGKNTPNSMNNSLYEGLYAEGLISINTLQNIRRKHSTLLFSLQWELKTLLYIGVMLFSAGLGILVYKNIDSISHQVVLVCIAAISAGCFAYCTKRKKPFSNDQVETPNSYFDYILLLGTLSFLSFMGYLQFQYEVFGTNYGLATFIPMIVLFFVAYYFDHLGILTMAIANLAIWMGISVTPKQVLASSNFNSDKIIYTYLLLGYLLIVAAYLSKRFNIKKHFYFSYHHYGVHLSLIALLAGFFYNDFGYAIIWLSLFGVTAWFIYHDAYKTKSFYFLLLVVIYSYIAISGLVVRTLFFAGENEVSVHFAFLYFIGSGIGFIMLLINLNKRIKAL